MLHVETCMPSSFFVCMDVKIRTNKLGPGTGKNKPSGPWSVLMKVQFDA